HPDRSPLVLEAGATALRPPARLVDCREDPRVQPQERQLSPGRAAGSRRADIGPSAGQAARGRQAAGELRPAGSERHQGRTPSAVHQRWYSTARRPDRTSGSRSMLRPASSSESDLKMTIPLISGSPETGPAADSAPAARSPSTKRSWAPPPAGPVHAG